MKRVFTAALLIGCISFFSGCTGQTENELQATPTPEVSADTTPVPTADPTPQPARFSAQSDMTFCRADACHVLEKSEESGTINGWMSFLNGMTLEEAVLDEENMLTVLSFDEHEVFFYEEDYVQIDDVVYHISNADELRESKHGYKFEQISAEVISLSEYVTSSSFKAIGIFPMGTEGLEIEFKDSNLKKEFVQLLTELVVVDPGFPVYGAGGYSYVIRLNNGSIEENNGLHVYINSEKLTTKQASCFNGTIEGLIVDLLIEQNIIASEDEVSSLFDGFETDKLKGSVVSSAK